MEFEFSKNIDAGIYGFALVLLNKLVSISSDGQRHFDLISGQGFHNVFILFHVNSVFFSNDSLYLCGRLSIW